MNEPNDRTNIGMSVSESYAHSKRNMSQSLLFLVVIAIAVVLLPQLRIFADKTMDALSFDAEKVVITFPNEEATEYTVYYADIDEIKYLESMDYGTQKDGGVSGKCAYGTWENTELGSYIRCSSTQVTGCIAMHAKDCWYVLNIESDNTTKSLCESITKQLNP